MEAHNGARKTILHQVHWVVMSYIFPLEEFESSGTGSSPKRGARSLRAGSTYSCCDILKETAIRQTLMIRYNHGRRIIEVNLACRVHARRTVDGCQNEGGHCVDRLLGFESLGALPPACAAETAPERR